MTRDGSGVSARLGRFDSRFHPPAFGGPPPHTRGVDLFPRVVARADERSGLDMPEAHFPTDAGKIAELLRRVVTVERKVVSRWPEVLTEREDIDVNRPQVPHHGGHFLDCLAKAE